MGCNLLEIQSWNSGWWDQPNKYENINIYKVPAQGDPQDFWQPC